jgi:hypothetical protein
MTVRFQDRGLPGAPDALHFPTRLSARYCGKVREALCQHVWRAPDAGKRVDRRPFKGRNGAVSVGMRTEIANAMFPHSGAARKKRYAVGDFSRRARIAAVYFARMRRH